MLKWSLQWQQLIFQVSLFHIGPLTKSKRERKATSASEGFAIPANIYLRCEICSNMFIDFVLVFLLLILNIFHTFFKVSFVDFEQKNVCNFFCGP